MKHVILTILIITGTLFNLHAVDIPDEERELLNQLEQTSKGDTVRLDLLFKLISGSTSVDRERQYIDQLLEEATLLKNNWYVCRAYLFYMYLAYNVYDSEDMVKWMNKLEPMARKEKYYDLLFLGKRCVVDICFLIKDEFERHEKESKAMLDEAIELNSSTGIAVSVQCLSNSYQYTYRNKQAAELLETYYPVTLKAGYNLSVETSNSLITIYYEANDVDNWIKWIKKQDQNIKQILIKEPDKEYHLRLWILMTYVSYLQYYNAINDLESSAKYLKLAEKHYFEGYGTVSRPYHMARYSYYNKCKMWDEALVEADSLLSIFKQTPGSYVNYSFMKAALLRKADRYEEALSIYDHVFALKDSLQRSRVNIQMDQMKTDYNANQLLLEGERIAGNIRLAFLIVVIVVVLLLIYLVFNTLKVRKILSRSEKEMREMSEEMTIANVAKENFLSNISASIDVPLKEIVQKALILSSDEQFESAHRKEIAARLSQSSGDLMKLINNILDLSRLEAGMMKYQDTEVEILPIIHSIIDSMKSEGPNVEILSPEELPFTITIDVARFSSVIKSLLQTADASVRDNRIVLEIIISENNKVSLYFRGTALAGKELSQNQIIVNEINRMLVDHFGGGYEIHSHVESPYVYFYIQ